MKTKTAYWITARANNGVDSSQYLLPNELHLIKTLLKDGDTITGIRKDKLSEANYKYYFG
jgi:hypothetical protein